MKDVIATQRRKVAEALDDGGLIDVARPHRSSYVDAAYCYIRSSVVCRAASASVVSHAKIAEPTENPFEMWTPVEPRKGTLDGVYIGATWRIRLNWPCAAAIRSYAKLL